MDIDTILNDKETQKILKKASISHLWLVGSYANKTNTDNSDIDLVYDRDTSLSRQPWGFWQAKIFLEKKTGKNIDLVAKDAIDPLIKDYVLSQAIQLW